MERSTFADKVGDNGILEDDSYNIILNKFTTNLQTYSILLKSLFSNIFLAVTSKANDNPHNPHKVYTLHLDI